MVKKLHSRTLWRLLIAAALAGVSCGGNEDCTRACEKVYDQCRLSIPGTDSKASCISQCQPDAKNQAIARCISKVSGCDTTAFASCSQTGGAGDGGGGGTAPPMKHPYTPPPRCLVCHEPASESDAPKVPTNHAGRTDGSCISCHAPGQ